MINDQLVYKLYALKPDEIEIVEGKNEVEFFVKIDSLKQFMNSKDDWRQTVNNQHQIWATIAGFTITGLVIFVTLGKLNSQIQKIVLTITLSLLLLQVILMLIIAEIERKTAFQSNVQMQEEENILRPILNVISLLSWLSITILLLITVWM